MAMQTRFHGGRSGPAWDEFVVSAVLLKALILRKNLNKENQQIRGLDFQPRKVKDKRWEISVRIHELFFDMFT